MDTIQFVKLTELFSGLTEEQTRSVASLARPHRLAADEIILRLGEVAEALFVVCTGQIDLTLPLRVMGEIRDIRFQTIGPGHVLAWSALVPPYYLTMSGAATVETEVLSWKREDILALLTGEPGIGYIVMSNLAKVIGTRLSTAYALWLREVQRHIPETGR